MELEQWLRNDMDRFVKQNEPREEVRRTVRHEDDGQLRGRDYLQRIKAALELDRYPEAKALFTELRDQFKKVPLDHQEERKLYYRLLQKAYKAIYDYVADQHKTVRIIHQLNNDANVFDESIAPVDLQTLEHDGGMPLPSIEDLMMRAPKKLAPVPKKAPEPLSMPAFEETQELMPKKEEKPTPITSKSIRKPPAKPQRGEFAPKWNPPDIHFNGRPAQTTPTVQKTIPVKESAKPPKMDEDKEVMISTAEELTRQARKELLQDRPDKAQEKLIEARFENSRAGGDRHVEEGIMVLEKHLAQLLSKNPHQKNDQEMFSTNYLQGIQAMAAGNYKKAAESFSRRAQQAPRDIAAHIRLAECMEVLNGKNTR